MNRTSPGKLKSRLLHLFPFPLQAEYVQLLALRNFYGSKPNTWNDCIIAAKGSSFNFFRCTSDPGVPDHPNPRGIAWLSTNLVYRFQRGFHRGRPALIQAEPFLIERYPLGRSPGSVSEKVRDGPGFFAINIHDATPVIEEEVNGWSAGCIAIRRKDGWDKFKRLCYSGTINHQPQQLYPLLIFDAHLITSKP